MTPPGTTALTSLVALQTGGLTTDMLVVFAVIAAALVLFVWQPVPIDVTAIGVMVAVILLEPWTGVDPEAGVAGFSNPATVTVLAMFVLSEGVRQTGAIQILVRHVSAYTGDSESRQVAAVLGLAGPPAGFVNNTPVVAILIPAVRDLANRAGTSPSKLLLPMSFVAMMGGTLTLIGTSSNLLASDVWARQGPAGASQFSMFEFTQLGVLVLAVGTVYLFTVGRWLTPARLPAAEDPGEEFGMDEYLTDVVVRADSSLVGRRVRELRTDDLDLDVFGIVRDGRSIDVGLPRQVIAEGDVLSVRADAETLERVLAEEHLELLPELRGALDDADLDPAVRRSVEAALASGDAAMDTDTDASGDRTPSAGRPQDGDPPSERGGTANDDGTSDTDADDAGTDAEPADPPEDEGTDPGPAGADRSLVEVVVLPGAWLSGREVRIADFEREHDVTVLALRRGSETTRRRMRSLRLRGGDALLVKAGDPALEDLRTDRRVVVSGDEHWESYDRTKIPIALGIVAGVVGLAALDLVPIMVGALGGIVGMIVTGCLRPADAYEAVNWDVIFLLAGVIPLGTALQASGAAAYLGDLVVAAGGPLPPLGLLALFYLFTALITNLISNNASIVLLVPVAVDAAQELGVDPFAFVLAVTFAASTAFMTPVGYQTNLMVYGPGGYRFSDFARVGAPLQLLLTAVTTFGIWLFWGL